MSARSEQDVLHNAVVDAEAKVTEGERRLQAVMVGKSENDGVDKTYAEQLKG